MNESKRHPRISFVATARNDNYGGNWVNRINAFIKVLVYLTNTYQFPAELILVEYNPVKDKKNLYDELTVEGNTFLTVRFIIVPSEFHETLPGHEKVTVCEFIAKNIAIRRAKGDFVLATNPDVIFSKELFEAMIPKNIQHDAFYRVNRRDLLADQFDPSLTAEQILELSKKGTTRIMYNNSTEYVSYRVWFDRFIHGRNMKSFLLCPLFNAFRKIETDERIIHENAAGDFLLMHKDLWQKVRGYDQMTVGSGIMDGYIMYVLYCYNFNQHILPQPLYHINHTHGKGGYIASMQKFREDTAEMIRTKKPYKINAENWGFPESDFREITR